MALHSSVDSRFASFSTQMATVVSEQERHARAQAQLAEEVDRKFQKMQEEIAANGAKMRRVGSPSPGPAASAPAASPASSTCPSQDNRNRRTIEFKGFPKGTLASEIGEWLEENIKPLSDEVEAAFATRKFNTMGQVICRSQPAKRALKLAIQQRKTETDQDLTFMMDGTAHRISYYDRVLEEEASRQATQRSARRAILRANASLTGDKVIAERGSGLVWVNRTSVASVDREGVLTFDDAALSALNLSASQLKEFMAEEKARK